MSKIFASAVRINACVFLVLYGLWGAAAAQTTDPNFSGCTEHDINFSPAAGTWFSGGKAIPIIQSNKRLAVDMSAFDRPKADGRMLDDLKILVTFPDDASFIGVLDGKGSIRWSNGTSWQASQFAGHWYYLGKPGPVVTQFGRQLRVNFEMYGRPNPSGVVTGASTAQVFFPDDTTHTATLVSPHCLAWSNGSFWTRPADLTEQIIWSQFSGQADQAPSCGAQAKRPTCRFTASAPSFNAKKTRATNLDLK